MKNVDDDDGYLVGITEPCTARFDRHTPESYAEIAKILEDLKDDPGLPAMEQAVGLKYNPHGLLFNPAWNALLNMPHCMFWDAMHCLFSSSAVGQIQCNGFIAEVTEHGISTMDLDVFSLSVRGHKLPKYFFTTRFSPTGNSMKAFASETIDAIHVLTHFAYAVLDPAGAMRDHVACMKKLFLITIILGKSEDIMLNVDALEKHTYEHKCLYNALYHSIPKGHYVLDIARCIRKHGQLATCFAPERDHHFSKTIGRHCFRNCTSTILQRCNYRFFEAAINDATMFQEVYFIQPEIGQTPQQTISDKAMTKIGFLTKGDFVFTARVGQVRLCTIGMFLSVQEAAREPVHFAVCHVYESQGPQKWVRSSQTERYHVGCILRRGIVRVDVHGVVHTCM